MTKHGPPGVHASFNLLRRITKRRSSTSGLGPNAETMGRSYEQRSQTRAIDVDGKIQTSDRRESVLPAVGAHHERRNGDCQMVRKSDDDYMWLTESVRDLSFGLAKANVLPSVTSISSSVDYCWMCIQIIQISSETTWI